MKEIQLLPEIIQKEWEESNTHCTKSQIIQFEDFKKKYNNFEGKIYEEFLEMCNSKIIYNEWNNWNIRKRYYSPYNKKPPLNELLNQFKTFWQYDTENTKIIFKEMELLSEKMIYEWRLKYNFVYIHIYENYNDKYEDLLKKSKFQLWEEFKKIWEIDILDYNENEYNEIEKYIIDMKNFDSYYLKEYPQNFYEYCENGNYHSYENYSILEKFEICKGWQKYCEKNEIDN